MGMGFAPTWLRQVSPLLHKTTLTTDATKFWRLLHTRTQYEKQQLQICVVIKLDARKIISTLSTANADARSAYDS